MFSSKIKWFRASVFLLAFMAWVGSLSGQATYEVTPLKLEGIEPMQFAEAKEVLLNTENSGIWQKQKDGSFQWNLTIISPDAVSLNLGLFKFQLPENGRFEIHNPDLPQSIIKFTPKDNDAHLQLWTPAMPGKKLQLSLNVPTRDPSQFQFEINRINIGFPTSVESKSVTGDCQLDVICSQLDGWDEVDEYRDLIRSVGRITIEGSKFGTAVLVNNTAQDCRPFMLTAAHLGITPQNAPSIVVNWNYENSFCRNLGSTENRQMGDGRVDLFNSGASLRAAHFPSDMTLIELDDPIHADANPFFAGWARRKTTPKEVICIHHPKGREKRISFGYEQSYWTIWGAGDTMVNEGNHLLIPNWEIGATEQGSSGAPLFNSDQQVVGTLHGGNASCEFRDGYDKFGSFQAAWEGEGTHATALKYWLDPIFSERISLGGKNEGQCGVYLYTPLDAYKICTYDSITIPIVVSPQFQGLVTLEMNSPQQVKHNFLVNPVLPGDSTWVTFKTIGNVADGAQMITITASDQSASVAYELELCVLTNVPDCEIAKAAIEDVTGGDSLQSAIKIFNGFSPNKDGINDTFIIKGIEQFPNSELSIYNRWGNLIFRKENYKNDWEGEYEGRPLASGTYYYVLRLHSTKVEKGFLQIHK